MFIGHALLAFALTVLAARRLSISRERALRYGTVAGVFASVPDVDIVYAPVGLIMRSVGTLNPTVFWETANVIHRGPTHSLIVGAALAVAVFLWVLDTTPARSLAVGLGALVIAVGAMSNGGIGAVVMLVYVVVGVSVAEAATRSGVTPRPLLGTALVGLLSHPFGDVFTGSPPPWLYPLDMRIVTERVVLHPDPTVHLLAAFLIEVGVIWLAFWSYTRISDRRLSEHISWRAMLGVGYGGAVLMLPPPTLEDSRLFVFSVLAFAVVGIPVRRRNVDLRDVIGTGLTAVTVAVLAYAAAYAIL